MVIVWRLRGNIIRMLCAGLCDTMFTLIWTVLTGPTGWVCYIGTRDQTEQLKTEPSRTSNFKSCFGPNQTESFSTCMPARARHASSLPTPYLNASAVLWSTQADTVLVRAIKGDFIHSGRQSLMQLGNTWEVQWGAQRMIAGWQTDDKISDISYQQVKSVNSRLRPILSSGNGYTDYTPILLVSAWYSFRPFLIPYLHGYINNRP